MADTLYKRLGGYDAIVAVADNLLPRLTAGPQLGRFWKHRSEEGVMSVMSAEEFREYWRLRQMTGRWG